MLLFKEPFAPMDNRTGLSVLFGKTTELPSFKDDSAFYGSHKVQSNESRTANTEEEWKRLWFLTGEKKPPFDLPRNAMGVMKLEWTQNDITGLQVGSVIFQNDKKVRIQWHRASKSAQEPRHSYAILLLPKGFEVVEMTASLPYGKLRGLQNRP